MIHHLSEIASYCGVSYTDFAAHRGARPFSRGLVADLPVSRNRRRRAAKKASGIPCSGRVDRLPGKNCAATDLAEWVARNAARGDHGNSRAHFP
ncbi:hypothetical protein C1N81_33935 [Streptomyces sp. SGAir0957]